MAKRVVTLVNAVVDAAREVELVEGYRRMVDGDRPDGLLRSELLRGQEGGLAHPDDLAGHGRAHGGPEVGQPACRLELLNGIGAQRVSHDWYSVEQGFDQG
jgi:hypothetical protein